MNFIFSIFFFYSKFSRTQYEALTKVSSVFSLCKSLDENLPLISFRAYFHLKTCTD